jgi:hypothetical protein
VRGDQLTGSSCRRNRAKSTQVQRAASLLDVRLQKRFQNLSLHWSRHEYENVGHAMNNAMIENGQTASQTQSSRKIEQLEA